MSSKKLAIIGGGAAGYFCAAILAEKNLEDKLDIYIFERLSSPMQKLLATGGSRCNLSNFILDYKQLSKNYPRGEKFLYSVFSKFSVSEMLQWLHNMDVQTYIDDNNCVFPITNNSETIVKTLNKSSNKSNIYHKTRTIITNISFNSPVYLLETDTATLEFDIIVISTGGNKSINTKIKDYNGYILAENLGHKIIAPKQVLAPLMVEDKNISVLSGITLQNIYVAVYSEDKKITETFGDILFTHKGLSGPLILNLSSIISDVNFNNEKPIKLIISFFNLKGQNEIEQLIIKRINENPNKDISNLLKEFYPKNLVNFLLKRNNINPDLKVNNITKELRNIILDKVIKFELNVIKIDENFGIVTAGGVDVKEIDSKTMQSKLLPNLYFAGEVINVDGFCGGFNLQFAWSSAYIAATSIANTCYSRT